MASSSANVQPVSDASEKKRRQQVKRDVCEEVLKRLRETNHPVLLEDGFAEAFFAHFHRLPTRYALDVNTERAEDVVTHQRMLEEAKKEQGRTIFYVRPVQLQASMAAAVRRMDLDAGDERIQEALVQPVVRRSTSNAAPPSFGSSPNLESFSDFTRPVAMEEDDDGGSSTGMKTSYSSSNQDGPMHEVTFSSSDRPKLLSQLSAVLADVGLNIREAHVFSTADGFSLDVFVVDGWPTQDVEELKSALQKALEATGSGKSLPSSAGNEGGAPSSAGGVSGGGSASDHVRIPNDGADDWEIDSRQLKLHHKIASGSFGDLYRGTYCGQDVAIKILKAERLNDSLQQEFGQEVFIMRKVRHKNVVQFIGACTKPPNLSIVTEFMSGGSVYDYLHKQRGSMKLPMLLRVAMDVAKGMDFLHKNNIIHRDLKAANLLMDEYEVVKVADFGVARVKANTGVMTAETGTYRWMAPEVIEHRPYDHRADVFSFGITLWELLTGKLPYSDLTPLQAAVGVVQKGLRPPIPKGTHPKLAQLMERCWHTNPSERPEFSEILRMIPDILREIEGEVDGEGKKLTRKGSFFSSLKLPGSAK